MSKKLMAMIAIVSLAFAQSCNNKDEFDVETVKQESTDNTKEFVNTLKGVAKDTVILLSTKNMSSGLKSNEKLYFEDLKLIKNKKYSNKLFPETFVENGRLYRKLNYDLNAGAGGDYIYLYYSVTPDPRKAISYLIGYSTQNRYTSEQALRSSLGINDGYRFVTTKDENYTDLNSRSGGWWVYLTQTNVKPEGNPTRAISDILIEISETEIKSTMFRYNGELYLHIFDFEQNRYGTSSTFYPLDFNKGTNIHNKYIYIATD